MLTNTDLRRWFLAFTATLCAVLLPIGLISTTLTAKEMLGENARELFELTGIDNLKSILGIAQDSGLWCAIVYIFPYFAAVFGFFAVVAHFIAEIFA